MTFIVNRGRIESLFKTSSFYEANQFYYERVRNKRHVSSWNFRLLVKFPLSGKVYKLKESY